MWRLKKRLFYVFKCFRNGFWRKIKKPTRFWLAIEKHVGWLLAYRIYVIGWGDIREKRKLKLGTMTSQKRIKSYSEVAKVTVSWYKITSNGQIKLHETNVFYILMTNMTVTRSNGYISSFSVTVFKKRTWFGISRRFYVRYRFQTTLLRPAVPSNRNVNILLCEKRFFLDTSRFRSVSHRSSYCHLSMTS